MASVADAFADDLDVLRQVRPIFFCQRVGADINVQEPQMNKARLALLIDSLASGADVFSSQSRDGGASEMEIVLGEGAQ
jgi:ribosome assembly protein 3